MSIWQEHHYEVVKTGDGSPSLRALTSEFPEIMHHSAGAWSETMYIYGSAIKLAAESFQGPLGIASVGFGLGYVELLSAAMSASQGFTIAQLLSFESDPFLYESFCQMALPPDAATEIALVYSEVFSCLRSEFSLEPSELLQALIRGGYWRKEAALNQAWLNANASPRTSEVILYDAFSAKTIPELWDEDFLTRFIEKMAAPKCVFSSFASRGTLKRALAKNGFVVNQRDGFHGKRNSTLATRGI